MQLITYITHKQLKLLHLQNMMVFKAPRGRRRTGRYGGSCDDDYRDRRPRDKYGRKIIHVSKDLNTPLLKEETLSERRFYPDFTFPLIPYFLRSWIVYTQPGERLVLSEWSRGVGGREVFTEMPFWDRVAHIQSPRIFSEVGMGRWR